MYVNIDSYILTYLQHMGQSVGQDILLNRNTFDSIKIYP